MRNTKEKVFPNEQYFFTVLEEEERGKFLVDDPSFANISLLHFISFVGGIIPQ